MENTKNIWAKNLIIVILLLGVFIPFALQFTSGEPLFDFTAFWIAGKLTFEGGDPYLQADWIPLYAHYDLGLADNLTFLYPKPILPLFIPFGMMDLHTASVLWLILTQASVFASAWILTNLWSKRNLAVVLIFVASIFILRSYLVTLVLGQLGGFFLLMLTITAVLWHRESWFFGGLVFSFLMLKPQLGLPIIGLVSIWFLTRRTWPFIYGVASGGILMLVIGWLIDPRWIQKFIQIGAGKVAATFGYHPTLWGVSGFLCSHESTCTLIFGGATSILILGGLLWLLFQRKYPLSAMQAISFSILAALLLTPYLWVYDQLLILIPLSATIELLQ
ncbi:MAG: glycosyltransferase family 87 protein, partial [Anaerolineales bacterium]